MNYIYSRSNRDNFYKSGIYKITIDNHIYIGSTKRSIYTRIREHLYLLNNNKHYNKKIQSIYTEKSMVCIEVLETCTKEIWKREQYWINLLKPDLNIIKNVAHY